ncbi:hypothetical protein TUM4438_44310 [Shewanella sairae]|uniref:Uncharacterized protein n=1 Tax=Shewanella sairae TaxID=190310 RepID=A0ABQ4PRG9_9GAMM|nr:hypothetical protein [Shewanella sairae]MCL1132095.1 hypothetical protein [Shewanella sairae]GIU52207.1 hypothetical protein TUM4438_44310 [Shewanella sairae]
MESINQFKRNLDYRLLIEQGYKLLLDVDDLDWPEAEFWEIKLSTSVTEEDYYSTVRGARDAEIEHFKQYVAVGEKFTYEVVNDDDGDVVWAPSVICLPALRGLGTLASRVLVKFTPIGNKVMANIVLVAKNGGIGIERSELEPYAIALQEALKAKSELGGVSFTVMVLDTSDNVKYRKKARLNSKSINFNKQKKFYNYVLISVEKSSVWSPWLFCSAEERVANEALHNTSNNVTDIFCQFVGFAFSWKKVVLSGILSFITSVIFFANSFQEFLPLVPLAIILSTFVFCRNQSRILTQVAAASLLYSLLCFGGLWLISPIDNLSDFFDITKFIFLSTAPLITIAAYAQKVARINA